MNISLTLRLHKEKQTCLSGGKNNEIKTKIFGFFYNYRDKYKIERQKIFSFDYFKTKSKFFFSC